MSESAPALPLTCDALIKAQKSDPSLAKYWTAAVDKTECDERQPFFVDDSVLMRRWVSQSGHAAADSGEDWEVVYQVVIPVNCR